MDTQSTIATVNVIEQKFSGSVDQNEQSAQPVHASDLSPDKPSVSAPSEVNAPYIFLLGVLVVGACEMFNQYFNIVYPSKIYYSDCGMNDTTSGACQNKPPVSFLLPWYALSVVMAWSSFVVLKTTRLTNLVSNKKESGITDPILRRECRQFEAALRNYKSLVRRKHDGKKYSSLDDADGVNSDRPSSHCSQAEAAQRNVIVSCSTLGQHNTLLEATIVADKIRFRQHLRGIFVAKDDARNIEYRLYFLDEILTSQSENREQLSEENSANKHVAISPSCVISDNVKLALLELKAPFGDNNLPIYEVKLSCCDSFINNFVFYGVPFVLQFLGIFNAVVGIPVHLGWLSLAKLMSNNSSEKNTSRVVAGIAVTLGLNFGWAKSRLNWVFKSEDAVKNRSRQRFHQRYLTSEDSCKEVEDYCNVLRHVLRAVGWIISFMQGFFFISGMINTALGFIDADEGTAMEWHKKIFSNKPLLLVEVIAGFIYACLWEHTSMRSADKTFWKMALKKQCSDNVSSATGASFEQLAFYNVMDCVQQMITNQSMLAGVLQTVTSFMKEQGFISFMLTMHLYKDGEFQPNGLWVLIATMIPALLYSVAQYYWTLVKAEEKAGEMERLMPKFPGAMFCAKKDSGRSSDENSDGRYHSMEEGSGCC
jgi:hypothetical protein